MVYGFVKQSGGHVAINSIPGQGTTVKIYLPRFVHAASRTESTAGSVMPAASGGDGATILVVEDDAEVRRSSAEALRDMGYQVLEAGDAMEGVRLIVDRGGIDLLFTDVRLPGGVNGRTLADAARSAQPSLRVLVTTGYAGSTTLRSSALDKDVHFIAKPFNPKTLAAKIREVLATT
jgi:CheY-like chemotaxis protein